MKWHGWSQLIDLVPEETSPRLPPLPVEEYSPQFAKSYPKIMTSHPGFFFFLNSHGLMVFFFKSLPNCIMTAKETGDLTGAYGCH